MAAKKKAYAPGYSKQWKAVLLDDAEQDRREAELMSDKWKQIEIEGRQTQARVKWMVYSDTPGEYVIELDGDRMWKTDKGVILTWDTRQEAREFLNRHIHDTSFLGELEKL